MEKAMGKQGQAVGKQMEYFLATGNLVSKTGLGLMQVNLDVYLVLYYSLRASTGRGLFPYAV